MIQTPAGQNFDVRIKRRLDYFQPGYGVTAMLADAYGQGTPAGNLLGQEPIGMAIDFLSATPNMLVRTTSSLTTNYYSDVPFGNILQQTGPVSFSRGSLATATDSDGTVKWASHNFLTNSESFDAAAWAKSSVTPTANSIAAPNGTTTADTLAASGANGTTLQTYTAEAVPYTFGVWLKRKTGTGNIQIAADNGTYTTVTITSDWALYTVTQTPVAGSKSAGVRIVTSADEIYAWGAHLYRSDLAMQANTSAYPTYSPTTPKNALGYTEEYSGTGWARSSVTVSGPVVAPNGLSTADTITSASSVSTFVGIYNAINFGAGSTISIYAKAGTSNIAWVSGDSAQSYAVFNLATETVIASANGTPSITPVGNGWYRIAVSNVTVAGTYFIAGGKDSYTSGAPWGNGTWTSGNTVYLWGAQISNSASLDPYVPVYGAAVTSAAYYGPRRDFDTAGNCQGLLVEELRTNLLLNTATLSTQNVTVSAVAHTLSFYGTGTVTLSGTSVAGPLVGTGANNRVALTFTPTAGTLTLTVTGSVTQAQLEAGAFSTSYIPSVATAATRSPDVATLNTQAFPYSATESTLIFAFQRSLLSTQSYVLSLQEGTTTNAISFIANADNTLNAQVRDSSAGVTFSESKALTGSAMKVALAAAANNANAAWNGVLGTQDTSVTMPSSPATKLNIGFVEVNYGYINGYIRQITYLPRRISNTELQQRTL